MFILNRRVNGEQQDKFTCKNASVFDYCISSVDLLSSFHSFKVLEFSKLYSDVHCPLSISMSMYNSKKDKVMKVTNVQDLSHETEKAKKWNENTEFFYM